ncbi:MAG: choline dehydrogenase [Burkholderiaceae bacterium]
MNFDYIVVGGGSGGCVLAARLSEDPSVSVALIEAGPADKNVLIHVPAGLALLAQTHTANWNFNTVPQKGLNGRVGWQPRGKVLGGSSSVNAMIYIRGHKADYDHWASEGNDGWSYDEVLPYFRRAEHNERLNDEFHGNAGPLNVMDLRSPNKYLQAFVDAGREAGYPVTDDFNGAEQEGVGPFQVTHKNGERFSAAKAYLTPNLGRKNLTVFTESHTTRILFEGKRASGVEFRRAGRMEQIGANHEVLMAAGALQTPQILMLSGVGPAAELTKHGIGVIHDLPGVGQNLHDHVDAVQVVDAPHLKETFGVSFGGIGRVLKAIPQWRNQRSGMLTTNFAEAGGFIKSQASEPIPDLQLHFVVGKLIDHGRKTVFGHGYSAHVCVLRPQSRGSVTLASADPLAAPLIDPNFFDHPDDMQRLVRGFRLMRDVINQPALAKLGGKELARSANATSDADIEQFIRTYGDTIYHPVGTCRMGPGAMDVVGADLRIHGLDGIRVVDASMMPRIIGGNTNAPTIMVAEKASDMIKAARLAGAESAPQMVRAFANTEPPPAVSLAA